MGVKFIYSEKANFFFFKISTVDLSYVMSVKSTVEISKNFSDYMNFTYELQTSWVINYDLNLPLKNIFFSYLFQLFWENWPGMTKI